MTKYITINGKIRHAHGPVGQRPSLDEVHTRFHASVQDMQCCPGGCGYAVCSQTGPCEPVVGYPTWKFKNGVHEKGIDGWHLTIHEQHSGFYGYGVGAPEDRSYLLGGRSETLLDAMIDCERLYSLKRHMAERIKAFEACLADERKFMLEESTRLRCLYDWVYKWT